MEPSAAPSPVSGDSDAVETTSVSDASSCSALSAAKPAVPETRESHDHTSFSSGLSQRIEHELRQLALLLVHLFDPAVFEPNTLESENWLRLISRSCSFVQEIRLIEKKFCEFQFHYIESAFGDRHRATDLVDAALFEAEKRGREAEKRRNEAQKRRNEAQKRRNEAQKRLIEAKDALMQELLCRATEENPVLVPDFDLEPMKGAVAVAEEECVSAESAIAGVEEECISAESAIAVADEECRHEDEIAESSEFLKIRNECLRCVRLYFKKVGRNRPRVVVLVDQETIQMLISLGLNRDLSSHLTDIQKKLPERVRLPRWMETMLQENFSKPMENEGECSELTCLGLPFPRGCFSGLMDLWTSKIENAIGLAKGATPLSAYLHRPKRLSFPEPKRIRWCNALLDLEKKAESSSVSGHLVDKDKQLRAMLGRDPFVCLDTSCDVVKDFPPKSWSEILSCALGLASSSWGLPRHFWLHQCATSGKLSEGNQELAGMVYDCLMENLMHAPTEEDAIQTALSESVNLLEENYG